MNPARGCLTTHPTYLASVVPPSHRGQSFQASLIKAEADLGLQCIHSPTKLAGSWPSGDSYSKWSRDRPLLIWQLETSSSQDKMSRILRKDQVGSNDREFCLQKFGLGKVGGDRPETMHVKASSSLPIKQESGGRNIDPPLFFYNVIDKIYTPPPLHLSPEPLTGLP